jgi:hypothetical protein
MNNYINKIDLWACYDKYDASVFYQLLEFLNVEEPACPAKAGATLVMQLK